eukprot:SAG11_NODE_8895_length_964_cov_1.023095_1_plen_145_part_01
MGDEPCKCAWEDKPGETYINGHNYVTTDSDSVEQCALACCYHVKPGPCVAYTYTTTSGDDCTIWLGLAGTTLYSSASSHSGALSSRVPANCEGAPNGEDPLHPDVHHLLSAGTLFILAVAAVAAAYFGGGALALRARGQRGLPHQ